MQLEELKNSMSTLEQVLAKTNAEIKIGDKDKRVDLPDCKGKDTEKIPSGNHIVRDIGCRICGRGNR